MKRTVLGATLLLPLLAGCGGGVSDDEIVLGVAGPMEMSYGKALRQAAQLAVDEVNRSGGIHGRRITLQIADDGTDPQRAIEIATRFRDEASIVAVIGHVTSGATLAAAEVYNDPVRGVLELSPTASSPAITAAGPWTFRICPSDDFQGPALATWALERLERRRAAVLYANDAYGRGVLQSFERAFQQKGGRIVARDPFLPVMMESETAVDPYLERALRANVDAVLVAGLADEADRIVRAARRMGFTGDVLGADGLIGLETRGPAFEGVYVSAPFLPDRPDSASQQFVQAYRDRYNETVDSYGALGYDAVMLVVRELRAILENENLSGQELRQALRDRIETVGSGAPAFQGVTGRIAFDENGDVPGKEIAIGVVRSGRLVTAES